MLWALPSLRTTSHNFYGQIDHHNISVILCGHISTATDRISNSCSTCCELKFDLPFPTTWPLKKSYRYRTAIVVYPRPIFLDYYSLTHLCFTSFNLPFLLPLFGVACTIQPLHSICIPLRSDGGLIVAPLGMDTFLA